MLKKQEKRYKKHRKIRAKIFGTAKRPRFCVFRSNKHIYAQLIDDVGRKTLVAASDLELRGKKKTTKITKSSENKVITKLKGKEEKRMTRKVTVAYEIGKLIAKKALQKKIERVVFDRGGYKYHGKIKALAEGAREEGLKF